MTDLAAGGVELGLQIIGGADFGQRGLCGGRRSRSARDRKTGFVDRFRYRVGGYWCRPAVCPRCTNEGTKGNATSTHGITRSWSGSPDRIGCPAAWGDAVVGWHSDLQVDANPRHPIG